MSRSRCPPVIEFGIYEIETWYSSPYPQEYAKLDKLYICEFCLTYMTSKPTLTRHYKKCRLSKPPATEIYRSSHTLLDGTTTELSVYEVDGSTSKLYCQNLCLLAKLFLDHKTLYYDVDPFLFYVLTQNYKQQSHFIGYFSKEKHCVQKNNVSCIMTLPAYQKHGYGRFLIEFSYLLSKREQCLGTPEKPLSDLGKITYNNYWKFAILDVIRDRSDISIQDISQMTCIRPEDVINALRENNMLKYKEDERMLCIEVSEEDILKLKKPRLSVNPECLRWCPYISPMAAPSSYRVRHFDGQEEGEGEEEEEQEVKIEAKSPMSDSTTVVDDNDNIANLDDANSSNTSVSTELDHLATPEPSP